MAVSTYASRRVGENVGPLLKTHGLLLTLGVASLAWLSPQQAHANCVVTSGAGTATAPAAGATVSCSVDAPNPFPSGIDGDFTSDNVTVVLQAGAGISTTAATDEGVLLDNDITVTLGAGAFIETTGSSAEAIDIDNNGTVTLGAGSRL
ncbi:MAG: hypothetical protein AAFO70_09420, partial [Pseudomonadota bacterium]